MLHPLARIPGITWQTETAVSTAISHAGVPALLGKTTDPTWTEPITLTSWLQYVDRFGSTAHGWLAPAVRGFFENKGIKCIIFPILEDSEGALRLDETLKVLATWEDISLIAAPGLTNLSHQRQLIDHCETLADRFVLLDGLDDPVSTAEQVTAMQQRAQDLTISGGSHSAAVFFPWILVSQSQMVPPSGHIAGLISRVDAEYGVHHAPANNVVEGAFDVRYALTEAEIAQLYPRHVESPSVNCIRPLPGRGLRLWGARTLSIDARWHHLPVRRLTLDLQRWLVRRMEQYTFEPNDGLLRLSILRSLDERLTELYMEGAITGQVSQDAWSIQCDSDNNPPEVIQAGLVVVDVAIAPTVPGEYLVIRLVQQVGDGSGTSITPA